MKVEYTIPTKDLQRLILQDQSDKFYLIVKSLSSKDNQIIIETTFNKARVISRKINQLCQIDPTINEYEIPIPENSPQNFSSTDPKQIVEILNLLLKSSTEKIELGDEKLYLFNMVRLLLGQNEEESRKIDLKNSSLKEALSLLRTEFHVNSIEYISSHFSEFIESIELSRLDDEIVIEIIDSYCVKNRQNSEENQKIFSNLVQKEKDDRIIMHFLLCIEYDEYDKEMSEYIISHLTDDVANSELSRVIEKFKQQLLSQFSSSKKETKKNNNGNVIECKYEGDELSGIFSYLKKKHGDDIAKKGVVTFSDANIPSRQGKISDLINYGPDEIDSEYHNQTSGSTGANDGWFEIDFGERRINLTSYTLRSCSRGQYSYPKSWRIVGSNDKKQWDVLNHQTNNGSLKGDHLQKRFVCEDNDKYYRYIRFVQEDSWGPYTYNIILTCIELFGSILVAD